MPGRQHPNTKVFLLCSVGENIVVDVCCKGLSMGSFRIRPVGDTKEHA